MGVRVEIEGLAELQGKAAAIAGSLDATVGDGMYDFARAVGVRAGAIAPKRTGLLAGSVEAFREEGAAGVRVTARKVSRGYPSGFPYPERIERVRPFLAPAVRQEIQRINEALDGVLDDVQRQWEA